MTLSIVVDNAAPWNALKHYFASGLSAAVLVVVALAGAGVGQASDPAESTTRLTAGRPPVAKIQHQSLVTYYLVESPEQAAKLRFAWSLNGVSEDWHIALVVDTPAKATETIKALTDAFSAVNVAASGLDGRIVDLSER